VAIGFDFATAGRILFGAGKLAEIGAIGAQMGRRALLVVGARSADESGLRARIERALPVGAVARCAREPHIDDVDAAVAAARDGGCDWVLAVGGGSALDCGKAAAGLLTNGGQLSDYLEGVGTGRAIERPAAPMVAVPTTAGTGSEVTRNAVLSGPGYKKSVRSALLLPRVALVDPELARGAPPAVTAACGMDALTQVIEPYLSRGAGPLTDGLALEGIRAGARGLAAAYRDPGDLAAREQMALCSLFGGICLANAGLGAVHGFAAALGALFPIPHGVTCAVMLAPVIEGNLAAARGTPVEDRVWERFARVAEALTGRRFADRSEAAAAGLAWLRELVAALEIPRLGALGVGAGDVAAVVARSRGASMRFNPIDLDDRQLAAMVEAAR
jgi:alcohol dehydrogenase class IV